MYNMFYMALFSNFLYIKHDLGCIKLFSCLGYNVWGLGKLSKLFRVLDDSSV